MTSRTIAAAVAVLLMTYGAVAYPQNELSVFATSTLQSKYTIESTPLIAHQQGALVDAVLRVIDPSPLAALDAEITTAQAAVAASASEAARLTRLVAADHSASQAALEVARSLATADATRLALAQRRVALEWSAAASLKDATARAQLLAALGNGEQVLVRIDTYAALPSTDVLTVTLKAGATGTAATIIGAAAQVDPRTQSGGVLATIGQSDLRIGQMLGVSVTGAGVASGVILPRDALVRYKGATWAYVRLGSEEFARREVVDAQQRPAGWFVAAGFDPGDEIVTRGAGDLMAIERAGEQSGEDD